MPANALEGALNGVLHPAYGTHVLRSSALFGAMVTAMGAGALLGAALYGIGSGIVGPPMMSVTYARVPEAVGGRVFGLLVAAAPAATPLGVLGAGLALDAAGLVPALLGTGALYLVVTLAPPVFPVWRKLDTRGPAEPVEPPTRRKEGFPAAAGAAIMTE
ncbi:hypothetical protein [Streptomyces virginiae]